MATIKANLLWAESCGWKNGIETEFECGLGQPMLGYLKPIGDCCTNSTNFAVNITDKLPSPITNEVFGVFAEVNGEQHFFDVLGDSETPTVITQADYKAKLNVFSKSCNCTDCTAATVPVVPNVYGSPANFTLAQGKCFEVSRTDDGTLTSFQNVQMQYAGLVTKAVEVKCRTMGVTTYVLCFNTATPPVLSGDTFVAIP